MKRGRKLTQNTDLKKKKTLRALIVSMSRWAIITANPSMREDEPMTASTSRHLFLCIQGEKIIMSEREFLRKLDVVLLTQIR